MVLTYYIIILSKFQSDKASMLDEAIEYLKSLQLQVQVYIFYFLFFISFLKYKCFHKWSNCLGHILCASWMKIHF